MEQWKDIEGFENYEVSTHGRVRKKDTGRILIGTPNDKNYLHVVLRNGIRKMLKIHRLVAQAFIPNPKNKPTVDHIDRNRQNNNIDNLRWATYAEQAHNTSWIDNASNIRYENDRNKYRIKLIRNGITKTKRCKTLEEAEAILAQFKAELGM